MWSWNLVQLSAEAHISLLSSIYLGTLCTKMQTCWGFGTLSFPCVSQCLAHSKHATNHPSLEEGCSTVIQLCFLIKTLFRTNMQLLFISIMSQRQWQISWRRGTLWITYSVLSSTCTAFSVFFYIFSPKRLPSKLVRLTLRFTCFLSVQIPNNHRKLD